MSFGCCLNPPPCFHWGVWSGGSELLLTWTSLGLPSQVRAQWHSSLCSVLRTKPSKAWMLLKKCFFMVAVGRGSTSALSELIVIWTLTLCPLLLWFWLFVPFHPTLLWLKLRTARQLYCQQQITALTMNLVHSELCLCILRSLLMVLLKDFGLFSCFNQSIGTCS